MTTDRDDTRTDDTGTPTGAPWPYTAAPRAELETMRREHVITEAHIRGVGSLALFGGTISLFGTLAVAATPGMQEITSVGATAVGLLSGVAYLIAGIRLRRLDPRGRALYTGLAVFGALWSLIRAPTTEMPGYSPMMLAASFAVGGLLLWLLWSARARTVFSRHYREVVIPATPGVRYRSGLVTILLILVLMGTVVAAAAAAAFAASSAASF